MKEKEKLKNALQKLEKIVEDLNRKDIDVEQGLEKFREGVELIKFCRSQLHKAENEFIQLKQELEQDDEQNEPEPEQESG
ncbi:MAG: exodeoxyribonuclease VII small subunit [Candidatus Omnitrophica bacterium]|nr:exodeoxyribonuclease VII small subunit [Candidatus Omnitrophota bacterium]MCM8829235.1 exodeoxyribonuclease VII small subunit [Candidatus Omnitrophota bacterium]